MREAVLQRLLDLSVVAFAVSVGSLGYMWNALEDEATGKQQMRDERALAKLRRHEQAVIQRAKQYGLNIDELVEKHDQVMKLKGELETLASKVSQDSREMDRAVGRIRQLAKSRDELEQHASDIDMQKRALDSEAKELAKMVKIRDALKVRSNHDLLPLEVHERNKELKAEIEELMHVVTVKLEAQSEEETVSGPPLSHQTEPIMQEEDPLQR